MVLWITAVAVAMGVGFMVGWLSAGVFSGARAEPALAERAHRSEAALEMAMRQTEGLRVDLSLTRQDALEGREQAAAQAAQLAEVRTQLDQERQAMRSATTHLRDTFQALAAEALKGANDQFLAMAQGGL